MDFQLALEIRRRLTSWMAPWAARCAMNLFIVTSTWLDAPVRPWASCRNISMRCDYNVSYQTEVMHHCWRQLIFKAYWKFRRRLTSWMATWAACCAKNCFIVVSTWFDALIPSRASCGNVSMTCDYNVSYQSSCIAVDVNGFPRLWKSADGRRQSSRVKGMHAFCLKHIITFRHLQNVASALVGNKGWLGFFRSGYIYRVRLIGSS